MSVVNAIPLIAAGDDGYSISRSLRLRSSASAYLNRTFTTATDGKRWTWAACVKIGPTTGASLSFEARTGLNATWLQFGADGFNLTRGVSGVSITWNATSSAIFRDPSSWYFIQLTYDSTQATSTNRIKIYVNGVQQTLSGSFPSLNEVCEINTAIAHTMGGGPISVIGYKDGYMAEVNFIDGQALAPSSFGEFSIYNQWLPKKYAGTYGTNGFYLPFTNNASAATLGNDFSGNGNTWTTNNISVTTGSSYDSTTDVPTLTSLTAANFCVLNPLRCGSLIIPSSGNLNGVATGTAAQTVASTFGISSGKFYWEVTDQGTGLNYIGIVDGTSEMTTYIGSAANGSGWAYNSSGQKVGPTAGTAVAYGATYTNNDVIGIALDMDAGTIVFYKNNASQGTMVTGLTGTWFPAISCNGLAGNGGIANFGQRPFTYTPPTGFLALNTFNL